MICLQTLMIVLLYRYRTLVYLIPKSCTFPPPRCRCVVPSNFMGTRIPPSLDFLVIYNKSLTALPETIPDDDDDAQEEAHILFYTCRQRAVTRDRTLRQVGLAKALASFSEQVQADWPTNGKPLLTYITMTGCSTGRLAQDMRLCIP